MQRWCSKLHLAVDDAAEEACAVGMMFSSEMEAYKERYVSKTVSWLRNHHKRPMLWELEEKWLVLVRLYLALIKSLFSSSSSSAPPSSGSSS
ncbi:hypothetical protein Bca52824_025784 [Brassica carinata]|uniref:Uncharacterized protein n=1 Tax=Brassica carinata TaxID=52824 RepID=A0A8X7VA19_BRACI|nr:hypothetical protein Bca52824_025784 [Brassica carinata]